MSSSVVQSVISPAQAEALDRRARESNTTKSELVRTALDLLLSESPAMPDMSLESPPGGPDVPESDKALADRLRDAMMEVYDLIPPVNARGETGSVTVSLPKDLLRAIDVLIQQPGVRQKTRSDFVRAAVYFGVQAIDRMQALDHPTWRSAVILGRQRLLFERQIAASEDIYAGARAFIDTLRNILGESWRGTNRVDKAIAAWTDYYQDALRLPEREQNMLLTVLGTSPVAQYVAWLGRGSGMIPDEFVPSPDDKPGADWSPPDWKLVEAADPDDGLPIPPHVKARRITLSRLSQNVRDGSGVLESARDGGDGNLVGIGMSAVGLGGLV